MAARARRVIAVFDLDTGRWCVPFDSQPALEGWLDMHPDADQAYVGLIPVTTRTHIVNATRNEEPHD